MSRAVQRGYSEFWQIDPPAFPSGYWFGLELLAIPLELGRLLARKLRRDPRLVIGAEKITADFTRSLTRQVDRHRVTEIRFDPRGWIRFEIPDGLVLVVDANDLLLDGGGPRHSARTISRLLDVPMIESRRRRAKAERRVRIVD